MAVPEAYLTYPAAAGEPPAQLVAFRPVALTPHQARTVTLGVPASSFRSYLGGGWTTVPGTYTLAVGPSSSDLPLHVSVTTPLTCAHPGSGPARPGPIGPRRSRCRDPSHGRAGLTEPIRAGVPLASGCGHLVARSTDEVPPHGDRRLERDAAHQQQSGRVGGGQFQLVPPRPQVGQLPRGATATPLRQPVALQHHQRVLEPGIEGHGRRAGQPELDPDQLGVAAGRRRGVPERTPPAPWPGRHPPALPGGGRRGARRPDGRGGWPRAGPPTAARRGDRHRGAPSAPRRGSPRGRQSSG